MAPVPEADGARVARRLALKQQTAPMLAQAIEDLKLVMSDLSLAPALRANARLTGMRVAESAVMLDRLADMLVEPGEAETRWDLTAVRVNRRNAPPLPAEQNPFEDDDVDLTEATALVQEWESLAQGAPLSASATADLINRIALALTNR